MDQLKITGLAIKSHIGVHQWEQAIQQTLLLDVTIPVDSSNCQNDLQQTIDYAAVCQTIRDYIEQNTFTLIERVANDVALLIKENFNLESVEVCIHKPHAIPDANDISIHVTR